MSANVSRQPWPVPPAERPRRPARRRRGVRHPLGERIYDFGIAVFRLLYRLWGLRVETIGAENLPTTGAAVLACNHIGFFDYSFIGVAAYRRHRKVRFLVRRGMFDSPVFGRALRAMRHVPVDRAAGSQAYRAARQLLDAGELVGVFPEGTISRSFTLKPFRAGAAGLAVGKGVPIIPMAIWGAQRLATVDRRRTLRRGIPVTLWISEPVRPNTHGSRPGQQRARTVLELEAAVHDRIAAMLDELQRTYPDRPRDDGDRWWLPRHLGGSAPDPETGARLDEDRMLE